MQNYPKKKPSFRRIFNRSSSTSRKTLPFTVNPSPRHQKAVFEPNVAGCAPKSADFEAVRRKLQGNDLIRRF